MHHGRVRLPRLSPRHRARQGQELLAESDEPGPPSGAAEDPRLLEDAPDLCHRALGVFYFVGVFLHCVIDWTY